eukprot:763567-Hanusia_phi.AAC.3
MGSEHFSCPARHLTVRLRGWSALQREAALTPTASVYSPRAKLRAALVSCYTTRSPRPAPALSCSSSALIQRDEAEMAPSTFPTPAASHSDETAGGVDAEGVKAATPEFSCRGVLSLEGSLKSFKDSVQSWPVRISSMTLTRNCMMFTMAVEALPGTDWSRITIMTSVIAILASS